MQQNLAIQEQAVEDGEQALAFTATGAEYFRIWIVNLLLTIVSLGIYSAWAKVRRNQYFYASTRLAGSSFEYHGKPGAILKGRIVAGVLIGAYYLAFYLSPAAGLLMVLVMAVLAPLLTWKSLQFKLHNTSYRGIRFGFDGSLLAAYGHYLLLPLLSVTGFLAPLVHHRIKRFQHTQSRFGTSHFSYDAPLSGFYKAYAVLVALTFLLVTGMVLLVIVAGLDLQAHWWASILFYAPMVALMPLFFAMVQNVIWNHTALGGHTFRCDLKLGKLCWIYFTNMLGIICSLGLFIPFARVRSMKYRLESMAMVVNGSLDNFVASEQEQVGAAGEGVADFMDLDLSL